MGASVAAAGQNPASLQEALAVQQQQQRMHQLIAAGGGTAGSNPRGAAPLTLSQQGSDSSETVTSHMIIKNIRFKHQHFRHTCGVYMCF